MNTIRQLFFLSTLFVFAVGNAFTDRRYVVDTIKAVVYGEDADDSAIVTLSDIMRPGIDGAVHTLDERVFEKLLWFDGKKHRILPSEEDIERHLKIVERENNIGRKELIVIFENGGYTFDEGKEQFGVMYTVNAMIDFKVRGSLFVSQKEVEQYYRENPEYVDATYLLKRGVISYDYSISEGEQSSIIKQAIVDKNEVPDVVWSPAFSVVQGKMAPNIVFVTDMQADEISEPIASPDGIMIFKVVDVTQRRLKTLDERYASIADLLRRPKYQEILTTYKVQLYDHASIVYF